ncbi:MULTISPECIES: hypothetical protein [Halomonas]|uniref:hypothetical protein n=1 Tax=Halomonas TaxID=2745 RepID=UPI00047457DB|nr:MULTISPECIES: hypothetical protein [Halomonas]
MNEKKLKEAESEFLSMFPDGFENPALVQEGKKHHTSRRTKQAREFFSKEAFAFPHAVADNMVKVITQSSLVSRFEKPRLKRLVDGMTSEDRESYALALRDMLHGDQEQGFNTMVELLKRERMAKWPLITVIPYYYAPADEVFVKPTTVKGILNYYEIEDIEYDPLPTYEFYRSFRERIIRMKGKVDSALGDNNAAFTWFLLMMAKKGA